MGQFKDLTLEEKSYIYGLLLTDGSLYLKNINTYTGQIQLEINKNDEDIVDKLCNIISGSTKRERIRNTNFKENYHSVSFNISLSSFIKEIIDFGFPIENKTFNARPPIVEYDKNAFWRGIIDGDGSLGLMSKSAKKNEIAFLSLTTQSEILKDEFCTYIKSITGFEHHLNRNKRDNIYNIGVGGKRCCMVLKEIYKDATIYLDRKYNKYLECLEWEKIPKKKRSSEAYKNKIVTEETKQKLSVIAKKRFENPENNPMYGKHHTEEAKRKMSEASKKRWENEEFKKQMSEKRKGMNRGKDSPRARQIVQLTLDNAFIKYWDCIIEAADYIGVSESCIRACLAGRQQSSGGFRWMDRKEYDSDE